MLLRAGALAAERRCASARRWATHWTSRTSAGSSTVTSSHRTCCSTRTEHVYLADFGLTKRLGGRAHERARPFGTIDYVAPEQIRGEEIDGRADVYALGCLLYECLVGVSPFRRGTDAATLFAHLEDEPPPLPGLDDVLSKALAKEPDRRQQTCGELIEEAREALGIAGPAPHPVRWPLAAAVAVVVIATAALLVVFVTRGGGSAPSGLHGRLLRIDPARTVSPRRSRSGMGRRRSPLEAGASGSRRYRGGTLPRSIPEAAPATSGPAIGRPYDVTCTRARRTSPRSGRPRSAATSPSSTRSAAGAPAG